MSNDRGSPHENFLQRRLLEHSSLRRRSFSVGLWPVACPGALLSLYWQCFSKV